MGKAAALFFCLTLALAVQGGGQAVKNQTKPPDSHYQNSADKRRTPEQPPPAIEGQPSGGQPIQPPADKKADQEKLEQQAYANRMLKINFVLMVCTLVLAVGGIVQAIATVRAANTTRMALKLAERADVMVSSASIELPDTKTFAGHSCVLLKFKNFGRTRAIDLMFDVSPFVPETRGPRTPIGPLVLAAGDDQKVRFQPFTRWMTEDVFRGIVAGTVPLRFDGKITYKDVFGAKHTTECAGRFDVETLAFNMEKNSGD